MGRKIVLTGGTGFILSYVAERYAALGDTVVLFDNNEQHKMPRYTFDLLEKSKNVSFVSGDICDKASVEKVIDGADIVYHFARERAARKEVVFELIKTEHMLADMLTKPVPRVKLEQCCKGIGLHK